MDTEFKLLKKHIRPEIVEMQGYISGEQPKPGEAVKLNTNENPYRMSPAVDAAIEKVIAGGLSQYPNPLGQEFREAASELYGVPADWILCGNGSDDILTILVRTFVGSGELLRLPYPSYILYKSLAEIQGAHAEEIHFNPDWSLPDAFSRAPLETSTLEKLPDSAERLKLVFLPNPNSPSGTVVPKERILEIAKELPCPLVVDEAYADFAEFNCIDLVEKCEKIIVTRTLSKSYALAGLRFGFLIAQPQWIEEMLKVKDSYNCDAISIAAASAAIRDTGWQHDNCAKILATREKLTAGMRKLGFSVIDSQANFTWNTHPTIPVKPIYEFLKANRYLVRYMNYPGWGDGLRISVGTDEQIEETLRLVEEGLRGVKDVNVENS